MVAAEESEREKEWVREREKGRERGREREKTEVIGTQLDLEWYLESRLGRGPG